jgi:hypothetical protein
MGLHFEITSFGNRPHNNVAEYTDVNTFERYQKIMLKRVFSCL